MDFIKIKTLQTLELRMWLSRALAYRACLKPCVCSPASREEEGSMVFSSSDPSPGSKG